MVSSHTCVCRSTPTLACGKGRSSSQNSVYITPLVDSRADISLHVVESETYSLGERDYVDDRNQHVFDCTNRSDNSSRSFVSRVGRLETSLRFPSGEKKKMDVDASVLSRSQS